MFFYKDVKKKIKAFKRSGEMRTEIDVPYDFKLWLLVGPCSYIYNSIILMMQKMIPPYNWKNALLRTTGIKIGKDVCMPHYHHLDFYFPELISIGDGSLLGGLTKLITHRVVEEDGQKKLVLGKIKIDKNVLLAGYSTINPGVRVNEYVITGMKCNITKDCPKRSFVVANDRIVKEWSDEDIDRLFHKSNNDPEYYTKLKKKTKEFRENPDQMLLRLINDGKRLNPGCEWYLARPTWRIYYNAIWVELARISPWAGLRKFFIKVLGAKLGKNVYIGKGVVFDHIYGDLVEIGDNARLEDGCYMDTHSYTIGETVLGRVKIGSGTTIGAGSHVMVGVTIGKDCHIMPNSSQLKDAADGETWKGIPAKKVDETPEDKG